MDYTTITLDKKDYVATVTLNRPDKLNALNPTMGAELANVFTALDADADVRSIVITGAGRAFCAGADVKDGFQANIDRKAAGQPTVDLEGASEDVTTVFVGPGQLYAALIATRKPVIAAINGYAVGFGLILAVACDIRIASDAAKFRYGFTAMGTTSGFGATYYIPRLLGIGKTCELVFTNKMYDAKQAKEMRLVNSVTPAADLMKTANEMAVTIAKMPPLAIHVVKRGVYLGMNSERLAQVSWEAMAINYLHETQDFKEATAAFLAKRDPVFKGR